jgi:hypothetical protein
MGVSVFFIQVTDQVGWVSSVPFSKVIPAGNEQKAAENRAFEMMKTTKAGVRLYKMSADGDTVESVDFPIPATVLAAMSCKGCEHEEDDALDAWYP